MNPPWSLIYLRKSGIINVELTSGSCTTREIGDKSRDLRVFEVDAQRKRNRTLRKFTSSSLRSNNKQNVLADHNKRFPNHRHSFRTK